MFIILIFNNWELDNHTSKDNNSEDGGVNLYLQTDRIGIKFSTEAFTTNFISILSRGETQSDTCHHIRLCECN